MAWDQDGNQIDMFPLRGTAGRDAALDLLETHRAQLVEQLRHAAWSVWHRTHRPVSVNDVRHVLVEEGYTGDPRILGTVFPQSEWVKVGASQTNSRLANARPIGLFIPKDRFAIEEVFR